MVYESNANAFGTSSNAFLFQFHIPTSVCSTMCYEVGSDDVQKASGARLFERRVLCFTCTIVAQTAKQMHLNAFLVSPET
jgi:hypothetical protein